MGFFIFFAKCDVLKTTERALHSQNNLFTICTSIYRKTERKQMAKNKKKHCVHVWINLRKGDVRNEVEESSLTPGLRFTVMKNQLAITAKTLKKRQRER